MGTAGTAEGPRRALRGGVRAPRALARGFRPPADARRQRVPALDREERGRARAGVFLGRRAARRAPPRRLARAPGNRARRHAPPLHASQLVLGAGRLGKPRQRRELPPVRRRRRRRPGSGRPGLGHVERADRVPARRIPRRSDPPGTEELCVGRAGPRAPPARPRRGCGRHRVAVARQPDRDRAQHARVRARSARIGARPAPRAARGAALQPGPARGDRDGRDGMVVPRPGAHALSSAGPSGGEPLRGGELLQSRAHPLSGRFRSDRPVPLPRPGVPRPDRHGLGDPSPRLRPGAAPGGNGGPARDRDRERHRHAPTTACGATSCASTRSCWRTAARPARGSTATSTGR